MSIRIVTGLFACLVAGTASASPAHLSCFAAGKARAERFGRLSVVVDLTERSVVVEAEKWPGFRWAYQNGKTGAFIVAAPKGLDAPPATVEQFVTVTPDAIVFGWRNRNGEVGQATSFDRDAIERPGQSCNWRSTYGGVLT